MKKRPLSRRDFLKLAGVGTAIVVPGALGYGVFRSAQGEYPVEGSPYVENLLTEPLDGSVPILLIVNGDSPNPFGLYLGEILRAEGINCFHITDLSTVQAGSLEKYDIAILAETPLSAAQAEMFEAFVARGGRFVGMRPDSRLAPIFGWERSDGTLSEGYIKTESSHPAGEGIDPSTLQFHGAADLYQLAGAQTVAWLYTDRDTASEYPAAALNEFGAGMTVAFAFDLAKSIALMRQGNPELANQDVDGLNGVRTVDMFKGWIDLERIEIPQADEQQRLFVNLLSQLSRGKRPLPRLWYFPEDKKSVLIATGDSHSNPQPFIEQALEIVEKYGGHMTVYYSPQIVSDVGRAVRVTRFWLTDHVPVVSTVLGEEFGSPTPFVVEGWRARGHDIALHPYADAGLEQWLVYWKEFTGRGYGPVSETVRTHRVLWTGWMETARLQASYGIRMNFDYYHVGPSLQKPNGEWPNGHLIGSGRPMRFIDEQGRILNLYQQHTHFADEHLIPMDVPGWGGWPQLSAQEAVEVVKDLLNRSVKQSDFSALGGQFHIDPFQLGGDPAEKATVFLDGSLAYAAELGVPIWSAQEWLEFTERRHEADFKDVTWDANASSLTLSLIPRHEADSTLTVLIPAAHTDKAISALSVDGVTTPHSARLVLGNVEYVQVIVSTQAHTVKADYA
ncbi:MAG: twin-arginine translocation signal domain-containing protein [Chloroflexi bacterium]|nr:twin-arginine translocation signal domain-containing protein [Chloroflexota bacterium]